jgi:hypothetical protein
MRCRLLAIVLLVVFAEAPAALGFVVTRHPSDRLVMNLALPDDPFDSLGYGRVSLRRLAEGALGLWNEIGVGSGRDHAFFSVRTPAISATPCVRDGVNDVRLADTYCGLEFLDALAVAISWRTRDGLTVETDIVFNSRVAWDGYPGPVRSGRRDFYRVAAHEAGHAIGLGHPDEHGQTVDALMNSRLSNIDRPQADDIAGAHALNWTASATPGSGALYRFFNTAAGTHFYTVSDKERASITADLFTYRLDGVAYYVYPSPEAGTAPIYRFHQTATGTHFYTISRAERDAVMATLPAYRYEGVAFYAFPEPAAGTVPVYRLYNAAAGTHMYTISVAERDAVLAMLPQFRFEGVAYHAFPTGAY